MPVHKTCMLLVALLALACGGPAEDGPTDPATNAPGTPATQPELPLAEPPTSGPAIAPPEVLAAKAPSLVPFLETGDLYVLDLGCECVLRISPAGEVSIAVEHDAILAVTGDSDVGFHDCGIAFDESGTMFFTESESRSILRRARGAELEVLASNDQIAKITLMEYAEPEGIAFSEDGTLLVVDDEGDAILRVDKVTGDVKVLIDELVIENNDEIENAELDCGIVGGEGVAAYVSNEEEPPGILAVQADRALIVASGRSFGVVASHLTRALNGDLLVVNATRDLIRRVTPQGVVSTYLNETVLERVLGADAKLTGGIAMDSDGNLYVAEDRENALLKFDPGLNASIWVSAERIREVTGERPDLAAGIAFEPR